MARNEFDKPTKRAALKRAKGACEAVGEWYGLARGQRCGMPLNRGVEFDHIDLEANSHDNSLANCAAVCIACHKHKTRTHDIPVAAKTLRQQDKNNFRRVTKTRPMDGSRDSGWKKPMNGPAVRR